MGTLCAGKGCRLDSQARRSGRPDLDLDEPYFCPRKLMGQKAKSIAINNTTGHAHGYGLRSSSALPCSRSTGTEF
jgi:hypothetical protein